MGERSPIEAAAVIAEIYVTTDLLFGSKTDEQLVVASISHRWFMDRLIENVVNIDSPGNTRRFVKLADGTFSAPPGEGAALSVEGDSSYLLRTRHGIELDFDVNGLLVSWKDTNNNTLTLSYASNLLQSISNGMGKTITLSYTGDYISQISDNTGRSVSYHYDGNGNLEHVTNAENHDTVFEYDLPGRLTRIYYPAHSTNPFVINTYGLDGKVATQQDANGNAWQYYISGYRTEEVNPLGDGNTAYYDANGKTIGRIDPVGNEITMVYDGERRLIKEIHPEGNYAEYEYDSLHNPVKVTQNPKPGSGAGPLVTQFTYDPVFSKLLTSTDPKGRTTTLVYDAKGNLERLEQPQVGSITPVTQFTYNSRGQVLTKTDPENRITRHTYDGATGDLLSVIIDDGGINLTTQFGYDPVGSITARTDPENHTTTFEYNNLRLATRKTGPAPFNYITEYAYDEDGRLTQTRQQTGDSGNPWQTTSITYTYTGKKHTVIDPENHATTYAYDQVDRLWQVTDAENQTTEYRYDAAGRLYQVIDAKLQTAREITYTPNSLKDSIKDGSQNATQYEYDGFDRLKRVALPDTSYESYTYDEAGNLVTKRTRAGNAITYGYDPLNRLISKILPGPQTTSYTYDLTGLQENVTDSRGTIHHQYDDALRLSSVQYPDGRTIGYQYDNNSNRTRLTYPDSSYVTYQYDVLNRLTDLFQNGTTLLAHYDYDSLSRRDNLGYGNGTSTSYGYQIDDDLASMTHQHSTGTVNLSYTTNNTGVRTHKSIDDYRFIFRPGQTLNTGYSANNLNQYTTVGGVGCSYDLNGNLISDGVNTYTYNAENRLTAAATPEHAITCAYDPMGRRVEKNVDGQITSYLHDGDQVLVEYDGSGSELRRYVYGPGIDEPISMIIDGKAYYYQFDGQGSVIAVSDDAGNYLEIYAYSVYGKPNGTSCLGNPYLYTSRAYDAETGLYYYRARYYNPQIGRFLQVDPIGYSDGMNLYAYVSNNPLMLIDPLGLCSVARTLDWIQGGLDAIGIFDPSPISDGISGIISLGRGDYLGASASGIAMFPYLGDLIGKGGKYGLKYGDEVIGAANKASKSVPKPGDKAYRVWGDEAGAYGRSWSRTDPRTVKNYRDAAGLVG